MPLNEPFTIATFATLGRQSSIREALSRLVQTGAIKRISFGVYLQNGGQADLRHLPFLTARVKTHLDNLPSTPFKASDLSHLGPERAVANVLQALARSGHLARVSTGVYAIPAHAPAVAFITTAKKVREAIRQHPTDGPFKGQTFKDYGSKIAVQSALQHLARTGEFIRTRRDTYVRAPEKPQTSRKRTE